MGKHRKLNPGDVIEHLRLIENLGYRKMYGANITFWKCECKKCGKVIEIPQKNIGTAQKDCGCWRSQPKEDLTGKRFGRLVVFGISDRHKDNACKYLECKCDCGNICTVRGDALKSGETQSCGCIHDELLRENLKKAMLKIYVDGTSVPHMENYGKLQKNNTSGVSGISWHRVIGKWQASVRYKRKCYHLGYYDDIEIAKEIVETARKEIKEDFNKWLEERRKKDEKNNKAKEV